MKIIYPMGFMRREIKVNGKRISVMVKRMMVWINPKGGYHYHKENPYSSICVTEQHKLVRLDTIKRRKTTKGGKYQPCPACFGDLRE